MSPNSQELLSLLNDDTLFKALKHGMQTFKTSGTSDLGVRSQTAATKQFDEQRVMGRKDTTTMMPGLRSTGWAGEALGWARV